MIGTLSLAGKYKGDSMSHLTIIKTQLCNHRECKQEFLPKNKRQTYCSKNCAKYESKIRKNEDNKSRYKSRVEPRDIICGSRKCDTVFTATAYHHKYCCKKCSDSESRARTYDRKCEKNPPKRKNMRHQKILSKGKKAMEYINPHFSAQWLETLWNKRNIA